MSEPVRDFIGYGCNPPNPRWPGEARLALNFVLNDEERSEFGGRPKCKFGNDRIPRVHVGWNESGHQGNVKHLPDIALLLSRILQNVLQHMDSNYKYL